MKDIAKFDKNFKVVTKIEREDLKLFDAEEAPFEIRGVKREGDKFKRLPLNVAESVSETVKAFHTSTSGGRIRFVTDSDYVAVVIKSDWLTKTSNMSLLGSAGIDIYVEENNKQVFKGQIAPQLKDEDGYEGIVDFYSKTERLVTVNLPLYSSVTKVFIGLKEGSKISAPRPYKYEQPIVFYGSSITQGSAASRPGTCYPAIVSRYFDTDYLNLGFSGGAKGEDAIAEYISNLDMRCFVMDYDYNASSAEELENTHEKMFKKIREKHPDIPVLIMSRPQHTLLGNALLRRDIIFKTYKNAVENGDKNVAFLDGTKLIDEFIEQTATVDMCHPNDSGFASMAKAVVKKLEELGYKKV